MPYVKNPRKVTKQQFSDGTTIDGSRIDDAMEEVVDRFNAVPKSDIDTRWMQTQYVMGFSKPPTGGIGQQPFLPVMNSGTMTYPATTEPGVIQNPWRIKASDMPDVQPSSADANLQWAWTIPLFFERPVIVDAIHVFLTTDTTGSPEYDGDFVYQAAAPLGYAAGDNSEDLTVILHVDNPYAPEERSQNDIEVVRNRFQINRENFTQLAWTGATDMAPATYPGGFPGGSAIILDNLNTPLHAKSRARLALVVPPMEASMGSPAYTNAWVRSGNNWEAAYFSVVLTVLEEIV